ncbi:tyrosine-type recombinase/integrase [Streptomyces sp. I5]|uniref:tyrosine-type recombinase/integrase n=1 Tax=Streptomyces sp. I5 TaxID=2759947 RepID=UPI0018EE7442|nr:tyrosine-type recombinase/integrase [Streptomyces sp. I5]MBJ6631026.1 tyrosine-type recombinase/integrase [Streptomyces sp. I5]
MSLVRTSMPVGKKPDNSLYLALLAQYRRKNKRALRRKEAFPLTLSYLVPMMEKAEADGRPIGWRDAAMFAFGYRFLGRSAEDVGLDLEHVTILDDRVLVRLAEDKTHKGEEQTIPLHDRPDLNLVFRLRRWVGYLEQQGVTTGPLFREVLRSGKVATPETRATKGGGATKRGNYLRPQTVNDRVKLWFTAAGLKSDGRPVSSHGLRAGGATDLGASGATDEELWEAGRWRRAHPSPVSGTYARPRTPTGMSSSGFRCTIRRSRPRSSTQERPPRALRAATVVEEPGTASPVGTGPFRAPRRARARSRPHGWAGLEYRYDGLPERFEGRLEPGGVLDVTDGRKQFVRRLDDALVWVASERSCCVDSHYGLT